MKGKILGAGAISGEDGVRYYYDEKELKNLKEGQKLEGCEVDFDIKDGKAVGVYITKGGGFNADFGKVGANVSASLEKMNLPKFDSKHIFWDLNEARANLIGANMHSVKFWFLAGTLFAVFGVFVGMANRGSSSSADFWLLLVSFVFILWGSFCLGKPSGSYKPFKYQLLFLVLFFVSLIFFAFIEDDILRGNTPYIKIIFAAIFAAITIYVAFLWCKALSTITKEKVFLIIFILGMVELVFEVIQMQPLISSALEVVNAETNYEKADALWRHSRQIERSMKLGFAGYMCLLSSLASAGLFAYATLKFREIKKIS